MTIENWTPHRITVVRTDSGADLVLEPAGPAPRLTTTREDLGVLDGVPMVRATMGDVTGLPAERPGVILVVSAMVAEAAPERADLACPGELIRDDAGQVVGCRGLAAGPGLAAKLRTTRMWLVRDDAPPVRFAGQSIPGVCRVDGASQSGGGKWSGYHYRITVAAGWRALPLISRLHETWGSEWDSWGDAAAALKIAEEHLRVIVEAEYPQAAARWNANARPV